MQKREVKIQFTKSEGISKKEVVMSVPSQNTPHSFFWQHFTTYMNAVFEAKPVK